MSYGLQIMDNLGRVMIDTSRQTWNYVGSFTALANQTTTASFPAGAGMTLITQQYLLDDIPTDQKVLTHVISTNGTQVSAQAGNRNALIMVFGR